MKSFDCSDEDGRAEGVGAAVAAVHDQHLVIMPTDTGYALTGYGFSAAAASRIRSIKGMDTTAPLQVLISDAQVLEGVAAQIPEEVWALAGQFWPGPLTMVVPAAPTVQWDIGGDTRYVQVRVPDHPVAIDLLTRTGPLIVSAARSSISPLIESSADMGDLEHHVAVFLDDGIIKPETPSTIVDCTSNSVGVLRKGRITVGQLVDVLGYMPRLPAESS
ncbi:MAG TPA: L-threonylcarbamoyladenylate synthase [Streptosporangiaceae bacterium]|jgi:tRNA threonylcarbamoyl adenosine modification protein (Sua5/YciO/YrdC/YwlC family)